MAAAAGPAGPAYLYDIISVQAKNPQLPPMIGQWDLNQVIHTGQPIAHNDLTHAKAVAAALNGAAGTVTFQYWSLIVLNMYSNWG